MKENKQVVRGIYVFTAIVYALVIILHEMPKAGFKPAFTAYQPLLHAMINGSCFLILISSLVAIKNKNVQLHKKLNTGAIILSVLFLLSYVVYHYFAPETKYGGDYKGVYYFILATHIILAGVSLPFILFAYYAGYTNTISKHKRLVRFTYPVWLYVTLTGVLVYLFLSPYYGQ